MADNSKVKLGAKDALIVVDVQNDFCPGGRLAVQKGDEVVPAVNALAQRFANVVLTQDWHPPGHQSFATSHPGRKPFDSIKLPYGEQVLWPDHCVQGSDGAALHKDLSVPQAQLLIRKGYNKDVDSYSAFLEADRRTRTGLEGYLEERGIKRVFVCGLATDFCVAWTALDARKLGFAAAELLSGLGYRFGWWSFREGIAVMRVAGWSALGAVTVSLIGVIAEGAAHDRLRVGFVALVISALALGFPAYYYYQVQHLPRIHDISTDTQNPPTFVAVLPARQGAENKTDYSPQTAEQQKEGYPDIAPAQLEVPPPAAFERALAAARAMRWDIVAADPAQGRIEATATTLLFGFKDDVAIRITPDGAGSRVDVRSLSRVGRSDFGTNAKRLRAYLKALAPT